MILYYHIIILDIDLADIKSDKHTEFQVMIYDGRRFILNYKSIIKMVSLQIYNSALVFNPGKSIIRNIFSD